MALSALTTYRLARWMRLHRMGVVASGLDAVTYILFNCVVPSHCAIGSRTSLEHRGVAVVLNRKTRIGRDCSIGAQVVIGGRGKGIEGVPVVGDRVYIGVGAKLLGGIEIGNDVVIGANSVVLRDVPSGATVAGVPARILRTDTAR